MPQTVQDIMTREVVTLREEENLSDIEAGMAHFGMRHVPVVDGDKLVGLVTHRDILACALNRFERDSIHQGLNASRQASTFVAAVMTRDVRSVRPDVPLPDAARLMREARVGCLPVTEEDGTLVGIVTENDFLEAFIALAEREAA